MRLSVIVPVYKVEAYLRRCVDSLLAQELEDYEIILVNDGSPDGCQAIIEEYCAAWPEKVRTVLLENGGQARARNVGLGMARGDYIGFVDSDDWIEPEMYPKLLEAAESQEADLVVCDYLSCYEDGSSRRESNWQEGQRLASAGPVWDKLFRRELIADCRFPEGLWYEDLSFSGLALLRAKRLVHVPEALYCYRIGHTSTMKNENARKNLDLLRILKPLKAEMKRLGASEEDYAYLLINHVLVDAINRLSLQHNPEKLAAIAELRTYVRQEIPDLGACESYRKEPRNRRIIMRLNYMGLEDLSRLLLDMKKRIKV